MLCGRDLLKQTVHKKESEVKSCEVQIFTMHDPVASLDYSEILSQIQYKYNSKDLPTGFWWNEMTTSLNHSNPFENSFELRVVSSK